MDQKLKKIIVISCITSLVLTSFNVSLSEPFLLRKINTKITTVDTGYNSDFLLGFDDGQARRYTRDFSSYVSLPVT